MGVVLGIAADRYNRQVCDFLRMKTKRELHDQFIRNTFGACRMFARRA